MPRTKTAPMVEASVKRCSKMESSIQNKAASNKTKEVVKEAKVTRSSQPMSQNDSFLYVTWDSPRPLQDSEEFLI